MGIRVIACLGAWLFGQATAALHLATHARAHVHAADGSIVLLPEAEGTLPDALLALDARALLAALEQHAEPGNRHGHAHDRDDHDRGRDAPRHEATGAGHLAVAFVASDRLGLAVTAVAIAPAPRLAPDARPFEEPARPGDPRGPPASV